MSSSSTHIETGRSTAHPDYVINARVAYDTYMAESTAAYRTYVDSLAAARSAGLSEAQQAATTAEPAPKSGKYRAGLAAVRQAGLPAVWTAGLIAARAAVAYWKYVASMAAIQPTGLPEAQPTAELSDAERAAAAAAESAAAYQKYVAGRAANGEVSDADHTAAAPMAKQESDPPAG